MRHIFLLTLILLLATPSWAWEGKVVKITDGDTITVLRDDHEQVKIRLYGVDCPEKKQAFGSVAKDVATELAALAVVEVTEKDRDRYGRIVGLVDLPDGTRLNREMIRRGLAWVYWQYCKADFCGEWGELERAARAGHQGLWIDQAPTPPWAWRKAN